MSKNRTPSRQVRRANERRRAKQLAKKEREQAGKQKQEEPDQPKRKKINWKLASGIIGTIVGIIGTIVKVAEFIRDTFFEQ